MRAAFLFYVLCSAVVRGQAPNTLRGEEILGKAADRSEAEAEARARYAYREEHRQKRIDKNGQVSGTSWTSYDCIFLEGEIYRKLVAEDGKPLDPKKAAQVEKEMAKTKAERRQRRSLRRIERKVQLSGLRELPRFYALSLSEEKSPNGIEAYRIEAKVKPGLGQESEDEKRAHAIESTLWVGKNDFALVMREDRFQHSFNSFEPGSRIRFEYSRVREECWMLAAIRMDVRLKAIKMIRANLQSEQTYSDFRKFDVESTISLP